MNEVTLKNIENLSDIQLSQLLHRLLALEAVKYDLEDWNRSVPFNITTADAGSDGRIMWSGKPEKTPRLRNKHTIFQNKATDLFPSNCYEEILETQKKDDDKRKLKEQLKNLVEKNGCYILFTNRAIVDNGKDERIKKFREAIKDAGHTNWETFEIDVYDANEIKDWCNEYIASVTLVQGFNNVTRQEGLVVWERWGQLIKEHENVYQTNATVEDNISKILSSLQNQNAIRINGHSGLGKTRLIYEAFRNSDLQKSLVYYDLAGTLDISQIKNYIISHNEYQQGIIVLDNCDVQSHLILSAIVNSTGNIKIITIGLDDSNAVEDAKIKVERDNQRDLVKDIIEEKIGSTHSPTDKEYINNISEGYPWVAIKFCDIVIKQGMSELNKIPNDQFFKKLISGGLADNELEYDVIRACAVFSSFGFLDESFRDIINPDLKISLKAQTDFIRSRVYDGTITETKFNEICRKFKEKDIIEQKGLYYIVKPTLLAIHLASDWLINTDSDRVIEIISELRIELQEKFVDRLKDLDQIDKAKDIVNELWGANSPFGTAEVLNTSWGSLLFRYVVEVNPIATSKALETAFGGMSKEQIRKITIGRRNLVWALEKLCFRKETFIPSAKIMFLFAVGENETWGNNATNQFVHLFQIVLAGTEVSFKERLEIIKWGLSKNDDDFTKLSISAMERGLMNHHFSRMGSADKQGSGLPLKDYYPDASEVSIYRIEIINLLTELALSDRVHANYAKSVLAHSIRGLLSRNEFEILKAIRIIIDSNPDLLWLDAIEGLRMTLTYEKHLSKEIVEEIKAMISKLSPEDLKNQLQLKISKPNWNEFIEDENGDFIDKPRNSAIALAERIVHENLPLKADVATLVIGEQRQGFSFGVRIGELYTDKKGLLDIATDALIDVPNENQNVEFIAGVLLGANDKALTEYIVDRFLKVDSIRRHAFYLIRITYENYEDILKLFELVDKYGISLQQFQNFQYGRALDKLNNDEVVKLCEKLISYGKEGRWLALGLIFMYNYAYPEKWEANSNFLKTLVSDDNMLIKFGNVKNLDGYQWSETVNKLIAIEEDDKFIEIISNQILEFCSQQSINYSLDIDVLKVIIVLFDKNFDLAWNILGKGIIGDYLTYFHLKNLIGTENGNFNIRRAGFAFGTPDKINTILKWVEDNLPLASERIANMMPLSIDEDKSIWHPFAKAMIDNYGHDSNVLENITTNMGTFGYMGSSVPYYEDQKQLLEKLLEHPKTEVKEWAKKRIDYTVKDIKREKLNDDQRNII